MSFLILVCIVVLACASNTFTQKGRVSSEEICYDDGCYITVYWEDGSYTPVPDRFVPDAQHVFRHCHLDDAKNIVCDEQMYEQPIRLFERRRDDLESTQSN